MSRAITRFFETEEEAIKAARSRAKTRYRAQYVYPTVQNAREVFYLRELLENKPLPVCKVRYDGDVIDLRKEEKQA